MKRTLTITFDGDWESGLRQAARRAGEGGYQGEHLGFATPGLLFGKLTERRWELVRVRQRDGVAGVRELARRVGRSIYRDTQCAGRSRCQIGGESPLRGKG